MAGQTPTPVPSVNQAALNAIPDQNVRTVLQQIVQGWNTRNGQTGNGDQAFLTRADLGLTTNQNGNISGISGALSNGLSNAGPGTPAAIAALLQAITSSILADPLFQDLGARIGIIDTNLDDLGISATEAMIAAQQANAAVVTSAQTLTNAQESMQSTMTTQFAKYDGNIAALQTSTTTTASALTALTTSTTQQFSTVNSNIGALTNTVTTNASTVSALSSSVSTQFAQVNKNISAVQTQQSTTANTVAAQATSISTLQANLNDTTASIQTEAQTRANADGALQAQYTVKVDTNGYVSGFGLASTANNAAPLSRFIVRADEFAIGSPSGPGIAAITPFIVYTTPQNINGATVQPGVYMNAATIAQASIGTLLLGGNAVTVPVSYESFSVVTGGQVSKNGSGGFNGNPATVATLTFTVADAQAVTQILVFAAQGTTNGNAYLGELLVDGSQVASTGGYDFDNNFTMAWSGTLGIGTHTVQMLWGAEATTMTLGTRSIMIIGCKR